MTTILQMVRPPLPFRLLALSTAVIWTVGSAVAQRPDSDLAKLRADFEKGLASASRLVDDIHRLTLHQLERERAEAGDYETAGKVKARLDAFERAPGNAAIVPPPVTHVLLPARAQTRDGANTDGGREYVDFRKPGGKAMWDLLGLEQGTYEVFLIYSVGLPEIDESGQNSNNGEASKKPGGTIGFGEVSGLGGTGTSPLEKRVTTTGAWENYIRESLGRHDFRNKTATVKLEAVNAGDGGLLRLKQLELVKVVDGTAPRSAESATAEPGKALQALRASYRKEMRETAAALRERFSGEFQKLEQEMNGAGDSAAAASVAQMRARLFPTPPTTAAEDDSTDPMPALPEDPAAKLP